MEPAGTFAAGSREVGVVVRESRRREYGELPRVEAPHLLPRHADGRGGSDVLGANAPADEQGIEARFVEAGNRAQGTGDEMQLVLDDQLGRA